MKKALFLTLIIFAVISSAFTYFIFQNYTENKLAIQKEGSSKLNHFSNDIINDIKLIESFTRKDSRKIEKCLLNHCEEKEFLSLFDTMLDTSQSIDVIFLFDNNKKLVKFIDILHKHQFPASVLYPLLDQDHDAKQGKIGPPVFIDSLNHLPLTFKLPNNKGHVGLLLEANILFDLMIDFNSLSEYKLGVMHFSSKKFYHDATINSFSTSRHIKLLNSELVFGVNYEGLLSRTRNKSLMIWLGTLGLCLLASVFIFQFLKNNEIMKKKYQNALSERNLLHTVLHDISNPLTYLNFGLKKISNDIKDKETMEKLHLSTNMINEVFDSVRGLSQLSSEHNKFTKTEVNLNKLIEDTITNQKEIFSCTECQIDFRQKDNSNLNTKIPENVLKNEVIGNLLGNAIKFSLKDKPIIIDYYDNKLEIINYAEEIPLNVIKDINNASPTKSKIGTKGQKGSGMGLYIVKIICAYFDMDLHFQQDSETQKVTTTLTF